jgi:hypothetical protein
MKNQLIKNLLNLLNFNLTIPDSHFKLALIYSKKLKPNSRKNKPILSTNESIKQLNKE